MSNEAPPPYIVPGPPPLPYNTTTNVNFQEHKKSAFALAKRNNNKTSSVHKKQYYMSPEVLQELEKDLQEKITPTNPYLVTNENTRKQRIDKVLKRGAYWNHVKARDNSLAKAVAGAKEATALAVANLDKQAAVSLGREPEQRPDTWLPRNDGGGLNGGRRRTKKRVQRKKSKACKSRRRR
jgi:hypothetical protein